MKTPFPGTGLIALRAGVPVLPVAITGTESVRSPKVLFVNPRLRVVIGEPFMLAPVKRINSEAARAATDEIMHRIADLLPPAYRGVYSEPGAKVARDTSRVAGKLESQAT